MFIREWISPAVVTYIIGKLMSFEPEDREIMANVDWVFLPVMNADGYEYTHTEDRLWRKSRSIHNGNDCIGVDLNRSELPSTCFLIQLLIFSLHRF